MSKNLSKLLLLAALISTAPKRPTSQTNRKLIIITCYYNQFLRDATRSNKKGNKTSEVQGIKKKMRLGF